jgi:hypothetical protein
VGPSRTMAVPPAAGLHFSEIGTRPCTQLVGTCFAKVQLMEAAVCGTGGGLQFGAHEGSAVVRNGAFSCSNSSVMSSLGLSALLLIASASRPE